MKNGAAVAESGWIGTSPANDNRKPLGLRDWQAAQQRARELEANGFVDNRVTPTIEDACKKYLADAEARNFANPRFINIACF